MNRSVSGANGQRAATAVEFAVNLVFANLPFGHDGHVEIDVAVASVEAHVGREVVGDLEGDVAVAGFKAPARGKRRALGRAHFDVSIAGLEFEFVKAAVGGDVSVAGRRVQFAVDALQVLGAVAAVQIHFALESGEINLAIACVKVHAAFARHLDNDVNLVVAQFDIEVVVRVAHIDLDGVAVLVLFDADSAFADLVARGFNLGFDGVLVPGGDADVGVGRFDPQVGLAADVVGLGPFISVRGQHGNYGESQGGKGQALQSCKFHKVLRQGTLRSE